MWSVTSVLGVGMMVASWVAGCDGSGEGPTTTTPTTTTTVAPTTTLDPIAAEEAAVSEAAVQARLARLNLLVHPADPSALALVETHYVPASPARAEIDRSLSDLAREGWAVRPHPTVPESVTVEDITFDDELSPTRASLVVCIIDSGIVYEPNATPDGGEAIVNDTVYAARSRYLMNKVDGVWRLADVTLITEWQGVTECPAES
jgi:hypothetical protein